MKLFDVLLGKTKVQEANLDDLFGLSTSGITLEAELGLLSSRSAGVCVTPGAAISFDDAWKELKELSKTDDVNSMKVVTDSFDYRWIVLEDPDFESLVTRVHMVNTTLKEAGWGPQLLCSAFGLTPNDVGKENFPAKCYLIYLYKRGTFYPFVPVGNEKRDNSSELRLSGTLKSDLKIEEDLTRWFPIWDIPVA